MSTSESKKKSSKKEDKVPVDEVHTANDWEHADLGDDQRKQKFLRLMGAKKHKDDSTTTDRQQSCESNPDEEIGPEKKHARSKAEDEQINRELEKQFTEGLQSKLNHTYHGGLGFHNNDNTSASSSTDWKHQSTKTKFIPAKTEDGTAMDHVKIDSTEMQSPIEQIQNEKKRSSEKKDEKQEKKKKRSS